MNVLILAGSLSYRQAGAAQANRDFTNALATQRDCNISLLVHDYDEGSVDPSIRILKFEKPKAKRLLWRISPFLALRKYKRIFKGFDLSDIDLCYTNATVPALAFRALYPQIPMITHTGAVVASREFVEEKVGDQTWLTKARTSLLDRWEHQTYTQSYWRHVVSTRLVGSQREDYFGLEQGFFDVCPYGVNVEKFSRSADYEDIRTRYGIPRSAVVISTAGRLVAWKGIDMVINALSCLPQKDVHLLIAGNGPLRRELEELSASRGLAERVHFLGHMKHPGAAYAASDFFVLPSRIESFGLVYAEAMLTGIPCIGRKNNPPDVLSSANDVIPEGKAGFCIADQNELVERMRCLIDDQTTRESMGKFAFCHALENYSCGHYVDYITSLAQRAFGLGFNSATTECAL